MSKITSYISPTLAFLFALNPAEQSSALAKWSMVSQWFSFPSVLTSSQQKAQKCHPGNPGTDENRSLLQFSIQSLLHGRRSKSSLQCSPFPSFWVEGRPQSRRLEWNLVWKPFFLWNTYGERATRRWLVDAVAQLDWGQNLGYEGLPPVAVVWMKNNKKRN